MFSVCMYVYVCKYMFIYMPYKVLWLKYFSFMTYLVFSSIFFIVFFSQISYDFNSIRC